MTAKTPVYGLEYIQEGEPMRNTRAALEANARTIEAALARTGIVPADVAAFTAAVVAAGGAAAQPQVSLVGAGVVGAAGWTVQTAQFRRLGMGLAYAYLVVRNDTAAAVNPGATGDVPNIAVIDAIPATWRPLQPVGTTPGSVGPTASGLLNPTGTLTWGQAAGPVAVGGSVSFLCSTYRLATP